MSSGPRVTPTCLVLQEHHRGQAPRSLAVHAVGPDEVLGAMPSASAAASRSSTASASVRWCAAAPVPAASCAQPASDQHEQQSTSRNRRIAVSPGNLAAKPNAAPCQPVVPMLQSERSVRLRICAPHHCDESRLHRGDRMSIERPWLASYPQGVPAEIDVDEFPSIVSVLQTSLREVPRPPGLRQPGQDAHLRRRRPAQPAVRGLPARRTQAQEGRSRRDHDAQLPAVPHRHVRRAARRA